jgi:DNA-binding NarL/FixJ family response regulator
LIADACGRAAGLRVLFTRGVESEADIAFAGLHDLVRPVLGLRGALPEVQSRALEAALALAEPEPAERFAVHAATLGLLAAAADPDGLLVVVDDAHWIDAPTRSALLFAARRLDQEGVLVVMVVRPGAAPDLEGAGLDTMHVEPLGEEAATALLDREAALAPAVRERVLAEAAGNPLALRELAGALTAAQRTGQEPLPSPLPVGPAIQHAFAQRVHDLPAETARALLVAAASDTSEEQVVGAAVAALGVAHSALEEAERAGLIALSGPALLFRHPALRSAVYHAADPADRRAAHRALADALTARGMADRAAWHRAAAAVEPDESVASALEAAAGDARRRGGLGSAAHAFEVAGRLSPAPADRVRRMNESAENWLLAGNAERAVAALDDALERAGGPAERADLQRLRGRVEVLRGRPRQAHDLLVHEAHLIESIDPARAAMLHAEASVAHMAGGDMRALERRARRAVELGDASGAMQAGALGRIVLAECMIARGEGRTAHPELRQYEPLLMNRDVWVQASEIVAMAASCCVWLEDFEFAERMLTGLIEHARATSAMRALAFPLAVRSSLAFRRGHWRESRADADEAARLARDVDEVTLLAYALAALAQVEGAMGVASARDRARTGRRLSQELGTEAIGFYADVALGLTELGDGREVEAVEPLERALEASERLGSREPGLQLPHPDLAEAYARAGRRDDAERLAAAFGERVEQSIAAAPRAALARVRLLLAGDDELDAAIADAAQAATAAAAPFERARTDLVTGERLRRARRRVDAREPLRAASRAFEWLGAQPWQRRAEAELQATGERVRPRGEPGVDDELTPQELRIAQLVAAGSTNKEVAAAVFLSPKTIEYHLASVYRKLGVRSRAELGHALRSGERAA